MIFPSRVIWDNLDLIEKFNALQNVQKKEEKKRKCVIFIFASDVWREKKMFYNRLFPVW